MAEVIAAILGVLLGALITWWMGRSRPQYIVCEDSFRACLAFGKPLWDWEVAWQKEEDTSSVSLAIGLPQTQIIFKDTPVDVLTVLRLKFRNTSDRMIEKPTLSIKLDEAATILGCDIYSESEQIDVGDRETHSRSSASAIEVFQEVVDQNRVTVTLDSVYPHSVCQEVVVMDIFCAGEAGDPLIAGKGNFQDGSVWATKFQPWKETRNQARHRWQILKNVSAGGLLVAVFGYLFWLIWKSPFGSLQYAANLNRLVLHPVTLLLLGWFVFLLAQIIWVLFRGWSFILRMPFVRRALILRLVNISKD